jgi:hypothetical protein
MRKDLGAKTPGFASLGGSHGVSPGGTNPGGGLALQVAKPLGGSLGAGKLDVVYPMMVEAQGCQSPVRAKP